jgi:hypothetical protein
MLELPHARGGHWQVQYGAEGSHLVSCSDEWWAYWSLASLVSSLPHLSPQFAIHQFVLSHHKQLSVTLILF